MIYRRLLKKIDDSCNKCPFLHKYKKGNNGPDVPICGKAAEIIRWINSHPDGVKYINLAGVGPGCPNGLEPEVKDDSSED